MIDLQELRRLLYASRPTDTESMPKDKRWLVEDARIEATVILRQALMSNRIALITCAEAVARGDLEGARKALGLPVRGDQCPICTLPLEEDGGCLRHEPEEVAKRMESNATITGPAKEATDEHA